ncbi:MAG: hypothetical protein UMU75_02990, partial [Halomonas sp.]|nr:hypothetical protein [Halomonas sp.]
WNGQLEQTDNGYSVLAINGGQELEPGEVWRFSYKVLDKEQPLPAQIVVTGGIDEGNGDIVDFTDVEFGLGEQADSLWFDEGQALVTSAESTDGTATPDMSAELLGVDSLQASDTLL